MGILIFKCTKGVGIKDYSSGGGGGGARKIHTKDSWFFGTLIRKMFSCACLPILFRGMAQKHYKITVLKGDICKHA